MKPMLVLAAFAILALAPVHPQGASGLEVTMDTIYMPEGVTFSIAHSGMEDYLFSWTDSRGNFRDRADLTLLLQVGETYRFQRTTAAHPFVITDDTLPVIGTAGSHERTTFDGAVINAAILSPAADFTADPAPTSDFIEWTPTEAEVGQYWYTCQVTAHTRMTGGIEVVLNGVSADTDSWSTLKARFRD